MLLFPMIWFRLENPPQSAAAAFTRFGGLCVLIFLLGAGCATAPQRVDVTPPARPAMWVDALRGEPMECNAVLDDLATARVVYLGEIHSIPRHHELQAAILAGLARRGVRLVLAMEQFEYFAQPALDRFSARDTDLNQLVAEAELDKRWRGHTNYHALLQAARAHQIPMLALNARAETIRAVGRQGLAGITADQRAELPQELVTTDPVYERLATQLLGVHMAFDPQKLRPIFEAQVARDETMAARLAEYLSSPRGEGRHAVVICGRGHCEFGLGMPDRLVRRIPSVTQRIVLLSESGDLHLSEAERKQAREIEVPHQFLRKLGRPPADYFHIIGPTN
jgi:uncharacterized iron-regulated protein